MSFDDYKCTENYKNLNNNDKILPIIIKQLTKFLYIS